jgi:hypothetical protein
MRDVQAMEFRGWLDGRGWLPAAALAPLLVAAQLPAAPAAQPAAVRPVVPQLTGVELTLVRRGERIVRVFAVAD